MRGVELGPDGVVRSGLVDLLNPYALVGGLATLALSGALAHDRLVGSGLGDLHHLVLRATSLLDLTRDGEVDDPYRF